MTTKGVDSASPPDKSSSSRINCYFPDTNPLDSNLSTWQFEQLLPCLPRTYWCTESNQIACENIRSVFAGYESNYILLELNIANSESTEKRKEGLQRSLQEPTK